MGDDRPSVYREGDVWVIRASAIGGCMRSLIAAGRDVEPNATPEWMQEKFDQGHAGEEAISKWYFGHRNAKPMGADPFVEKWFNRPDLHRAEDGQWEFNLRVAPNIVVRGHFDDIGVWPHPDEMGADFIGAEYKLLAPSTYAKATGSAHLDVIPTYPWQIGCYMAATGWPWDWVTVEKNEDGTPNFDRTEVVRIPSDHPPKTLAEIKVRALEIIDWVENRAYDEYPDCPVPFDYPCPYFLLHDEPELPVLEGDDADRMRSALDLRQQLKNRIVLMNDQVKTADETIKTLLGDRPTVMVDGTRVTWVHSESPEKWIEPKPYMKKASVTDYPKITPPKEKKE